LTFFFKKKKGATEVRVASLLAGLPDIVPCTTVNRQCSSGLQAIANVASAIKVLSRLGVGET
jgi:acetyl-CoA acyltransferase 1